LLFEDDRLDAMTVKRALEDLKVTSQLLRPVKGSRRTEKSFCSGGFGKRKVAHLQHSGKATQTD